MNQGLAKFQHRLARLDDLPAIVAIYNSTIASREVTADVTPITTESRLAWFAEHNPQHRPLWVVEAQNAELGNVGGNIGGIIGWLSYSNFYGRPAYAGTAELSIYIDEQWRGQGLGRYLLQEAISFAPRIAVHTLLGFIFGHNLGSLKLFDAFAFERWAHLPNVANLDGIERDLIIVGKRVG